MTSTTRRAHRPRPAPGRTVLDRLDPRHALAARVAWLFGILSVAMAIVLAVAVGYVGSRSIEERTGREFVALANQMGSMLDRGMYERIQDVRVLAQIDEIRDPAVPADRKRDLLEELQQVFPHYAWIGLTDAQGRVLVSAGGLLEGADVSQRPWFQLAHEDVFAGDVHDALLLANLLPRTESGEPVRFVDAAAPVRDASGEFSGVLGAHMSWEWAREVESTLLDARQLRLPVDVFILDQQGRVLMGPPGMSASSHPEGLPATGSGIVEWDGERYLVGVAETTGYLDYPGLGWSVVVRESVASALAPADALRRTALVIGIGGGLLLALLAAISVTRALRPLRALAATAASATGEGPAARGSQRGADEIDVLSRSIRGMIDTLRRHGEELEQRVQERTRDLEALQARFREESIRDALTGLHNRRYLEETLQRELARARRDGSAVALAVLDIDWFKRVNDAYGHPAGDHVLRAVAQQLSSGVRETDTVCRLGGEEFCVVFPVADAAAAAERADALRRGIRELELPFEGTELPTTTVSIGVAAFPADADDAGALLERADAALYRAKGLGRNRVERA